MKPPEILELKLHECCFTFNSNIDGMNDTAQKLVLTVPTSKMATFLEALRQFDFVKVESLEEIMNRFITNAPKKVEITDEEIADILMEVRYGQSSDTAE